MRDMDTVFVSKCIQEHRLDPTPVVGFHADPEYWRENERWRRVVERYPWGVAMFLNDRTRNAAATVVAVGKIDLDGGKVSTQGGWRDIQPGWYREMAMGLKSAQKQSITLTIPQCLGYRESDQICDGGLNPATKKVEPVCAWRERCISIQEYAADNNKAAEDVLKSKSPEQIVQFTTRLLERKPGKRSAQLKVVHSIPKPAAVSTVQPSGALANGTHTTGIVMAAIITVVEEVAEAAGIKVSTDRTRNTALPGELFLVDRTANSDYISVYVAHKPKAIALASFRLRPRTGLLVQLPVMKESPLLSGIVADDVKVWKDGAFQSAVRDVQLSGNRLEHIKHIMLALVQQSKGS